MAGSDTQDDDRRRDVERTGGRQVSLGRIAGIPVHVSPSWFLVAAVITVGFAGIVERFLPDIGTGKYVVSFLFAVLLYASVLIHELSHALTARRVGLRVHGITLHFIGGHTEFDRSAPTPRRDIIVSAAGPLASLLIAGIGFGASILVDHPIGEFLLIELAIANGLVGAFNLLPALPLDGGHILRAIVWAITGDENKGTVIAARCGQLLAGIVLVLPFVVSGGRPTIIGMIWGVLVAALLWSGARQALMVGRVRARLPDVDTATLTRRAAPIAPDVPVSEALALTAREQVHALVVVDPNGRPTAVVSEAAIAAVPEERRPWVVVAEVSRRLRPGMTIPLGLSGEELVVAMRSTPATEYLVVDDAGAIHGVLAAADVDATLAGLAPGRPSGAT